MTFGKHLLIIEKREWLSNVLSRHFSTAWPNLDFDEVEPTWENYEKLVSKIETGVKWRDLEAHQEEAMRPILAHPETRLRVLTKDQQPVGYALIGPASAAFDQFNAAASNSNIIEIHNLALFKGQRGNGLGKPFFEMMFSDLFKKYDKVVWGTSDFNADTLVKFYTDKLKMRLLGYQAPRNSKVA